MIKLNKVVKRFGETAVLDGIDLEIPKGSAFGLIGSNGAGKSTILRLLCGVYESDVGDVMLNGKKVYDNAHVKSMIFFVNDETVQFSKYTLNELKDFYKPFYPNFSEEIFENLRETIKLPLKKS